MNTTTKKTGWARILSDIPTYHMEFALVRNKLTAAGHIGGSMMGAILGLNPYHSKMRAWMELSGQLPVKVTDSEMMWCGRMLEDSICDMFEDREERTADKNHWILQHPQHDFLIATPDFFINPKGEDGWGILEIKNTSVNMASNWSEGEIGDAAHAQMAHYLNVTGLSYGYIAVLVGGNKLITRRVEYSTMEAAIITDAALEFMNSIVEDQPPGWGANDLDLLSELHPEDKEMDSVLRIGEDHRYLVDEYRQGQAVEKEGKKVKQEAQAKLIGLMGDHIEAYCGDTELTWKTHHRDGYTVDPSSYKRFNLKVRK